ncbi:MAG: GrpB family protein, partial [Chloroflexi bacterium]|nr:GrpB family protein [Chloroflexota bacterium]
MIGLKKGKVQVVPHHVGWRDLFEQERGVIHERIGRHVLDIQHVGSTAVLGLEAKPIIDIAVAVASTAAIPQCRKPLCDVGYIDRGDCGMEGGYLFV